MTKLSIVKPETGKKNTIEEPKVATGFTAIETVVNGEIEGSKVNIKEGTVDEGSLSTAVQTLLNTKSFAALTVESNATAAITGVSGKLYLTTNAAPTVTLPVATANRIIGVFSASSGICKIAVNKGGELISGGFINAVASINLTNAQHVILQAEGTNWLIMAGEPKREQTWGAGTAVTKAAAEAGVTPSATRPALVLFRIAPGTTTIGGSSLTIALNVPYWVNQGQVWKGTEATETQTLLL